MTLTLFDLFINLIESFASLVIVNLVYQKKEYLKLTIFTLISFSAITLANIYSFDNYLFQLIDFIIIYLYNTSIIKELNFKNMLISVLPNSLLTISTLVTYLPFNYVQIHFFKLEFLLFVIVSRIIFCILIYFIGIFIRKIYHFNTRLVILSNISLISIGLLFGQIFDLIFENINPNLYIVVCLLLILFFNIILIFTESLKDAKNLYNQQLQLNILEEKKNNYLLSKESIKKTTKLKHDLAHVYNSILYEINNDNKQGAIDIIRKQLGELDNINKIVISDNDIIDYCIALQSNTIHQNNIKVICDALPNDMPINNEDLFIVFGNLFQNAVENCQPNPDYQIYISAGFIKEFFYIEIRNTITKQVLTNNPHLNTNKANKELHGIGINTCKNIINKYGGMLSFSDDKLFFHAKITVPSQKGICE